MNNDTRWDAVLRRDRNFDGRFVFAVTSTNVYCRPSCPSRRPRRERVRFFDDVAAAEKDGFRPCLRCKPGQPELVDRVRALLDQRESVTLAELAKLTGASAAHIQRTFRERVGVSPREYLAAKRAERLKQQLRSGSDVTTATYEAGYGSSSRLYSESDARLGMTPATYRDGGRGMTITFDTAQTSIGTLLVASTDRGVCAVSIGDDAASLERELREEFPNASIERATSPHLTTVVDVIERGSSVNGLPLDLRSTAFELAVWNALRKIPRGETRTYGEVAAAIGHPTSARAVANACAHNRAAIVVPCHRVVRADGAPGGYRWGAQRKRALLERERG